jgi:tetratricopeptide (TPR) repeat protein
VDRLTRHQLKQDEFRVGIEQFEEYFKKRYREILTGGSMVVLAVGLVVGLRYYTDHREAAANADLGEALATFRAYVGQPVAGASDPNALSFPTAQEKYKKALQQFEAIVNEYTMVPRPKAVGIARYHAGVCQSLLDDYAGAIQTLTEASQDHDPEIAGLAKFALAGELAKSGKLPEAAKLYQELADHPTLSVPKAEALLAMADAYRGSQPAQARRIYERVEKEFSSSPAVAQAVRQEMADLTQ